MDKKSFGILPVTCHTKHVGLGTTFVAIRGMKQDGVSFIPQALRQGATTIVVEKSAIIDDATRVLMEQAHSNVQYVDNARLALARLSAQVHQYPARELRIIAVTGTKGKTTTTFLIEHILRQAGYVTALLSTVKNRIVTTEYETELTTQQPDYIHAFLRDCVKQGVEYVVMEVAAQAFSLHRTADIIFDCGLFLNFDQEHGEFYATQEDYFAAKASLFDQLKKGAYVILNQYNAKINALVPYCIEQGLIPRFFMKTEEESATKGRQTTLQGIRFEYDGVQYNCPALVGDFNNNNARAAITCVSSMGVSSGVIQQALLTFEGVPGRLDKYVLAHGALAFIDYAHNPSSFESVLKVMKMTGRHVIAVFGAGGDRDASKRPLMGNIATQYADQIILTMDNPRSEDPGAIIQDIMQGISAQMMHKVLIELDRAQAIKNAYHLATPMSIIMLLGKGPDEYQIIKGEKIYFSEREILRSLGVKSECII